MLQQQLLDLTSTRLYRFSDFIITPNNLFAYKRLTTPENWPMAGVLITGDSGYGKTHLLECWKQQNPDALSIDNIDTWQDTALFHAYNKAIQQQQKMLFTASKPPGHLQIKLADLRSRLSAMTHITIEPADDNLLKQLLEQSFQQRQLRVNPDIIDYILLHAPRAPQTLQTLVGLMDEYSLTHKSPITKRTVSECLQFL